MSGMQAFMRAANLGAPSSGNNLTAQWANDNQIPMVRNPSMSAQNMPASLPQQPIDEELHAQVADPETDMLRKFQQSVLNPPDTRMTYPKSTLNGLTAALQVAATPTDYEKNRVYIGGNPYQQAKVYTDRTTGEKKYIQPYKQPGFMEQVMKAMPAAVSGSTDILNEINQQPMEDWKLKNQGMIQAIGAESQIALANQRNANANAAGTRADQAQQKIDISRMTAEEKVRASQLNTMTDAQKQAALLSGKVTLQDMNNAAALLREREQQAGATTRTGMQQTGANARTAAQQTGANERNAATITAAGERNAATIAGAGERNEANIASRLKLKQTPSAGANATSQLPTQQIKAAQLQASKAIQDNPKWESYLSIDQNGMVHIDPPSMHWWENGPDEKTYNAIKDYLRQGMPTQSSGGAAAPITDTGTTKPNTSSSTTPPVKAPGSSKMPPAKYTAAPGSPTLIPMITPDGKSVRMVPESQVQTATSQGYKPQQAKK